MLRVVALLCTLSTIAGCTGVGGDSGSDLPDRQAEAEQFAAFLRSRDDCMTEEGFPAKVYEDGGRTFLGAGALGQDRLLELLDQCAEQAGGMPEFLPPLDVEKEALYDLEIEAYQCLVDQGYTPEPPTTREQFVATFDTGNKWTAHARPGASHLPDDECSRPTLADITW